MIDKSDQDYIAAIVREIIRDEKITGESRFPSTDMREESPYIYSEMWAQAFADYSRKIL